MRAQSNDATINHSRVRFQTQPQPFAPPSMITGLPILICFSKSSLSVIPHPLSTGCVRNGFWTLSVLERKRRTISTMNYIVEQVLGKRKF